MREREVPLRTLCSLPTSFSGPDNSLAGMEIKEVEGKAAAILEQSRKEAAAIKEEAIQARQQAIKEGQAEGEVRGYREGLARAEKEAAILRQEAAAIREEARQVLKQAQRTYRETITAAEAEIIELVLAVARKVISQEIEQRPEVVKEITRQAILQVTAGQAYTIYAGPEAAEILHQRRAELLAEAAPGARLQVIVDPGLKAGGCRVETENGFIDASIDTQLEEVKKILRAGGRT